MEFLDRNTASKRNLQEELIEEGIELTTERLSDIAKDNPVKTAIGCGTIIEGKFRFDSPVRIDGELSGEILSDSILIVGETAVIKAQVKVGSLIIYGKVIGDIIADELVYIKHDGILDGNVTTARIAIDEGGYFKGQCVINN